MIILKSREEIDKIAASCAIVAEILAALEEKVAPEMTTKDLDAIVEAMILKKGGKPAFKGYKGYPKSICTSVNDVVVHGIPNGTVLKTGDIVSVDIGVLKDGFYGDAARTYPVGHTLDTNGKKLLAATEKSLDLAAAQVRAGGHLQDISWAVQNHVESQGFSVVRDFVGHGIGRQLHEDPPIPNFGRRGHGPKLEIGMVFAIEPMVNEGDPGVKIDNDGWTARTIDGKRSAHFEHCVAVTADGPRILSKVH